MGRETGLPGSPPDASSETPIFAATGSPSACCFVVCQVPGCIQLPDQHVSFPRSLGLCSVRTFSRPEHPHSTQRTGDFRRTLCGFVYNDRAAVTCSLSSSVLMRWHERDTPSQCWAGLPSHARRVSDAVCSRHHLAPPYKELTVRGGAQPPPGSPRDPLKASPPRPIEYSTIRAESFWNLVSGRLRKAPVTLNRIRCKASV